MEYELVIIGGGPAGVGAGVYAARKKINTFFIAEEFGGQSIVSPKIENWIGDPEISGEELADKLKKHIYKYEASDFVICRQRVTDITKKGNFTITLKGGDTVTTKKLFIATGSERRKLKVPGAKEYDQKGLTYCASCDGPLFTGKDVAVIGGGNAGFETALQLLAYTKSVTLLHQNPKYKADAITVEKALTYPIFKGINDVKITEVKGETFVNGLSYEASGKKHDLDVEGIFVEIGLLPSTHLVKGLVDLDDYGRIIINPNTQMTSDPDIWAAGDCTNTLYHQNNVAVGQAVQGIENLFLDLRK